MIKILSILLSVGLFTTTSTAVSQEETASVMSMKAALEMEPANPVFLSELGLTYIKDKKFQQAIPPLEQSLKIRRVHFKTGGRLCSTMSCMIVAVKCVIRYRYRYQ